MKRLEFVALFLVVGLFFSSCIKDDELVSDNENIVKDDENNINQDKDQTADEDSENPDAFETDQETIDEGGIITKCTPGETRPCYDGPTGSSTHLPCKAGVSTCVIDGTDWSECVGQVLPTAEKCGDGIDQNCDGEDTTEANVQDFDGDGYNYCTGDCCETSWDCKAEEPDRVNSGAYEFDDNSIDDNCNGEIDEKTLCDEGLALAVDDYPGNAMKLAKGMGMCAGLQTAEISLAGPAATETIDDSQAACGSDASYSYSQKSRPSIAMPYYDNKYKTFAVEPKFGDAMIPLEGVALSILSTGDWDRPTGDASCATLDTGDMKTASKIPEDWINMMPGCEIPKSPSCGGQAPQSGLTNQCAGKVIPYVQDPLMLTVKLKVPTNARAFEFNLFFLSIEFPNTVCNGSNYNDFFIALLDSTYNAKNPGAEFMNPTDKNLAKDANGNPVGVDLAPAGLFTACDAKCVMNKDLKPFCKGDQLIKGTGFECQTVFGISSGSGGTGWLKTTGNVEPGEEITLRFAIWEQGSIGYGDDHSWDSTVVLDGFKWLPRPGKPGTEEK